MLKLFKKKRKSYDWVSTLAEYNAEKARGIIHTQDWNHRMKIFQARFNEGSYYEGWREDA